MLVLSGASQSGHADQLMQARLAVQDLETYLACPNIPAVQSTNTFGSSPIQSMPSLLGLGDCGMTNQAAESASTLATAC